MAKVVRRSLKCHISRKLMGAHRDGGRILMSGLRGAGEPSPRPSATSDVFTVNGAFRPVHPPHCRVCAAEPFSRSLQRVVLLLTGRGTMVQPGSRDRNTTSGK